MTISTVRTKKASGRLRLLYALKPQLDDETATTIYNTMVVPLITFYSIINLKFNDTQLKKLTSLDNRARNITKNLVLNSIHNKILRNSCCIVGKCIDSEICFDFINYFVKQDHSKNTRNNQYMLKLPQVKLELAKNSFYSAGILFSQYLEWKTITIRFIKTIEGRYYKSS